MWQPDTQLELVVCFLCYRDQIAENKTEAAINHLTKAMKFAPSSASQIRLLTSALVFSLQMKNSGLGREIANRLTASMLIKSGFETGQTKKYYSCWCNLYMLINTR